MKSCDCNTKYGSFGMSYKSVTCDLICEKLRFVCLGLVYRRKVANVLCMCERVLVLLR